MKTYPIIVLGGGVIGLSAAYELAKRGKKVLLLETRACGGQATGAAAGMLAPYSEIVEDPDDFFRLCHQSLQIYPEWQEEIRQVSGLDFEYSKTGSLNVVFHEADIQALQTRAAWQGEWGIACELIDSVSQLQKLEPHLSKEAVAALYYPTEHHIYAPDYVQALQQACLHTGVEILEQAEEVSMVEVKADGVLLQTKAYGNFCADQCIVASGAWTNFFEEAVQIRLPIFPIRGQICAFQQEAEKIGHLIFSSQGYVVTKNNGTIVCGASEDVAGFDQTVTEKGVQRLVKWSKKLFPFLAERNPFHSWAGLRPATQDGFPLIGRIDHLPSVILSSGHYRNGILLHPINAQVVADIVEGKEPSLPIEAFTPSRFS